MADLEEEEEEEGEEEEEKATAAENGGEEDEDEDGGEEDEEDDEEAVLRMETIMSVDKGQEVFSCYGSIGSAPVACLCCASLYSCRMCSL